MRRIILCMDSYIIVIHKNVLLRRHINFVTKQYWLNVNSCLGSVVIKTIICGGVPRVFGVEI